MTFVPFASVSSADVRSSGEKSLEELRRRAAHGGPIETDTWLYRVEFHVVREDHDQVPKKQPAR
jgi:hypothetical protein